MSKIRWRLWLPTLQVALAIVLSVVGKVQTEHRSSQSVMVWDYIAPTEIVLHSINYPAAVATGLTVRHRSFQIGIEYSVAISILYLAYILVLWYIVGWWVGRCWSNSTISSHVSIWLSIVGIVASGLLFIVAFGMLHGPNAPLMIASAFLWSVLFLAAFSVMLAMRIRARP